MRHGACGAHSAWGVRGVHGRGVRVCVCAWFVRCAWCAQRVGAQCNRRCGCECCARHARMRSTRGGQPTRPTRFCFEARGSSCAASVVCPLHTAHAARASPTSHTRCGRCAGVVHHTHGACGMWCEWHERHTVHVGRVHARAHGAGAARATPGRSHHGWHTHCARCALRTRCVGMCRAWCIRIAHTTH